MDLEKKRKNQNKINELISFNLSYKFLTNFKMIFLLKIKLNNFKPKLKKFNFLPLSHVTRNFVIIKIRFLITSKEILIIVF